MSEDAHPGFVAREYVRCPECDLRGSLDATGKPYADWWSAIRKCVACGGRGAIPLNGSDRIDPYARPYTDPKAIHYANKRARTAWTQRDRFKNDLPNWLVRLQQEPPGGFDYGRKRGGQGSWLPLEPAGLMQGRWFPASDAGVSTKRYATPRVRESQRAHGTAWRYRDGCRCSACTAWKADQNRVYREKNKAKSAAYMREYRRLRDAA
jgi:hypothetical protein